MANESVAITEAHIERVRDLIYQFMHKLDERATEHDESKFSPEEQGPLDEMQRLIATEGQAAYGSPEYDRRTKMLGPMLEHHYANNSHHPEHYPDGVAGMDLFDLVEMFLDWKAASERGEESAMNLSHSVKRFNIEPQLASIMSNTALRLGWSLK